MRIALAGVAAAALLSAQAPASYAADSVSAPSTNVRAVCLWDQRHVLVDPCVGMHQRRADFFLASPARTRCSDYCCWSPPRSQRADMLLRRGDVTDTTILMQAPEGVKKVVCASNPTSKICLKNSYMKKETGGSSR